MEVRFLSPYCCQTLIFNRICDHPLKRLAALYNSDDSRAHESSKNACPEVFESKDLLYTSIKQS